MKVYIISRWDNAILGVFDSWEKADEFRTAWSKEHETVSYLESWEVA